MTLPNYQVIVLDPISGAVRALFDATVFYDLKYSVTLNDVGTIAMTLPSTQDTRDAFVLDALIEVYREDVSGVLQKEETYLTRLTHRFIEGDEERFVVGGVSLNHLLMRRVIDPDDDPLVAGGYSTKSGFAAEVIWEYCNEQIGPGASAGRSIPTLTISPALFLGDQVGSRLRHDSLFKSIQDLAKSGHVDFNISRTVGVNLLLDIGVIGTDRTFTTNDPLGLPWVGLTPLRGNLTLPSLESDRKEEGNFVYALGQGQRDRRVVLKQAGPGVSDSPLNRMEFSEDVRNATKTNLQELVTGADVALKDKAARIAFTYQPTGQEPGNTYHVDWEVGDAVTVTWDENTYDLRIVNIEITIGSNGETIAVTVTDDFAFSGIVATVVGIPTRATMWHREANVLTGNALTAPIAGSQRYLDVAYQSAFANADSFTHSFFIRDGAYILSVLGQKNTNCGEIDWYIDNVLAVTGQDWYGGGVVNALQTANVTVVGDGYHTLKGVVNGKNGLSSNYAMPLTKYWLRQASD